MLSMDSTLSIDSTDAVKGGSQPSSECNSTEDLSDLSDLSVSDLSERSRDRTAADMRRRAGTTISSFLRPTDPVAGMDSKGTSSLQPSESSSSAMAMVSLEDNTLDPKTVGLKALGKALHMSLAKTVRINTKASKVKGKLVLRSNMTSWLLDHQFCTSETAVKEVISGLIAADVIQAVPGGDSANPYYEFPSHAGLDVNQELTPIASAMHRAIVVKDRSYRLKKYKQCFLGQDVVAWLLSSGNCVDIEDALRIGNEMIGCGLFSNVTSEHLLKNAKVFYRWHELAGALFSQHGWK